MHLDEERLQRLLHAQLAGPEDDSARAHVAECPDCRARLAAAAREESEVHALLREVDHPPPEIDADAIAARGRARGWGRWAAGTLLALGLAGAAYAAPGLPVRAWVNAAVDWIGGPPKPSPDQPVAGLAVNPGQSLVVLFTSLQAGGQARVSLTDGAEVVVRAPIGAATFTVEVERVVIDNRGPTTIFEIQIPRAAPRVEIRVGGNRIFLKEGTRVTTSESAASGGPYLLRLTPAAP